MEPDRVKHLEFLQTNIARMNQCSFQMKGWAIAIVSALLAVYAATINDLGEGNKAFLIVAVFPTIIFGFWTHIILHRNENLEEYIMMLRALIKIIHN